MPALSVNFDSVPAADLADLEELAADLVEPANFRPDREGHWARSFRALNGLRSLINLMACYDILFWEDGTSATPLAAFDSDGEQADTESLFISVLLPTPGHNGRFGVFVSILVSDIDNLLLASDRTAAGCAQAVAQALTEAVVGARSAA